MSAAPPSAFWAPFLKDKSFVVLDGGLASELERRGHHLDGPLWSARLLQERPEAIRQIHLDYFRAGAQVVVTASYQASIEGFRALGFSRQIAKQLLRYSTELALEAREQFVEENPERPRPLVAASVGPYGAFRADGSEYRGNYGLSVEQLKDWHEERITLLADSGADLLACETIPGATEVEALLEILPSAGLPYWMSVSCKDDGHLCAGDPIEAAARLMKDARGAVAFGVNCTPPQFVEPLLRGARTATTLPLLAYPNRGKQWDAHHKRWSESGDCPPWEPDRWIAAGALLVGGCCQTSPEDVRAMTALG